MLRIMNARFNDYVKKLTPAKQLLAREAVHEYLTGESEGFETLSSSVDVWKKSRWLSEKETEHFVVYYMKNNSRIICDKILSFGGLDSTIIDVRVILKEALLCGATVLICVHNHPSGSTKPSRHDDKLTQDVKIACGAIGLRLVDHVIVTDTDYYSYAENGRL